MTFARSVDLGALAGKTDGFSGADLQALVYNAHLEVVHDAIAALPPDAASTRANGAGEEAQVKYTVLGGQGGERQVMSRAEEAAFQRRVRVHDFLTLRPADDCARPGFPDTATTHLVRNDVEAVGARAEEPGGRCGGGEGT